MPKLTRVDGRKLVKAMECDGFGVARIESSHHIMLKVLPDGTKVVVPVPVHGNHTIKIGTLTGILRKAGISRERFNELLK